MRVLASRAWSAAIVVGAIFAAGLFSVSGMFLCGHLFRVGLGAVHDVPAAVGLSWLLAALGGFVLSTCGFAFVCACLLGRGS